MAKIHEKLQKTRIALNAIKLNKSGHNKFAGYKYFELGDFLPQAQKIMFDNGLCGVVSFSNTEATLTINDFDSDDAIIITSPNASAALKGCHDIQNLGAVETYQRRYLWTAALELAEHDAIDASEPTVTTNKKTPVLTSSEYIPDKEDAIDTWRHAINTCLEIPTLQTTWQLVPKHIKPLIKADLDKKKEALINEELHS